MSKTLKITNKEIGETLSGESVQFTKYVSPIINLANQYAGGTRPSVVGQMSDLIRQFPGEGYHEWAQWYGKKMPNGVEDATARIWAKVQELKEAFESIDEEIVRLWAKDLILLKTYQGFKFQDAIIIRIANELGMDHRLSTPEEESKGIDGFIGETPVSVKPMSYKAKQSLPESITVKIIYYEEKKGEVVVEYDL